MTIPQILSVLIQVSRNPAATVQRVKPKLPQTSLVSWQGKARTRREDELARFQQATLTEH